MTSIMSFEDDEATKAERPPMTSMVVKVQRPGILLTSQVNELLAAMAEVRGGAPGIANALRRIEEVLKVGGYEGAMPAAPALPARAVMAPVAPDFDDDFDEEAPPAPVPAKPASPAWTDEADAPFISGS